VVDTLLSDGTFSPRAITRNPASEKALALKAKGVQVAQADLWDKESIKKAITGCEGVFGVRSRSPPLLTIHCIIHTYRSLTSSTPKYIPTIQKAKSNWEKI
jgi:hypothetical protein